MELSVVIPVYNEEECVPQLLEALVSAISRESSTWEIIAVDDGSTDETMARLLEARRDCPQLRIVQLRCNAGQTAALKAGIDAARGKIIVTMDGDLQNDPRDIPELVAELKRGCDLASGWRRDRQDPFLTRILPSLVSNWLIAKVTRVPIHDTGCALKAYRAEFVKDAPLYAELHRFIPAMVALVGGRVSEVVVRHHPRSKGTSKYGLMRILRVPFDILTVKMLIAFREQPLQWFALLSLPASFFCLLAGIVVVLASGMPGPLATSILLLVILVPCQLLFSGLIAELVVRTGRPPAFRTAVEVHGPAQQE